MGQRVVVAAFLAAVGAKAAGEADRLATTHAPPTAALLERFPDRGFEVERAFVREALDLGAARVYWA